MALSRVITCVPKGAGMERIEDRLTELGIIPERVSRIKKSLVLESKPLAAVIASPGHTMNKFVERDPSVCTVIIGQPAVEIARELLRLPEEDPAEPRQNPCQAVCKRPFAGFTSRERFEVKGLLEIPCESGALGTYDVWARALGFPVVAVDKKAKSALVLADPSIVDGALLDSVVWFLEQAGAQRELEFEGRARNIAEIIAREAPRDPIIGVLSGDRASFALAEMAVSAGLRPKIVLVSHDKKSADRAQKERSKLRELFKGCRVSAVDISKESEGVKSSMASKIVASAMHGAGVNVCSVPEVGVYSPFEGLPKDRVEHIISVWK